MDVTYEVREGYLYVQVTGEFDKAAVTDILYDWIDKIDTHGLNKILWDITLMKGFDVHQTSNTTIDRYIKARFISESLPKDVKLAILETPQQLERTVFNENVIINRRANVKAISNIKEALKWLGVTLSDRHA